jgi:hypothetical protein
MALDAPVCPESPPTARKRRRNWLVLGLLLVILLASWYFLSGYLAQRYLEAALAEVDRLDPGWRLEDLEAARTVVRPEENSAPWVMLARGLMPAKWFGPKKFTAPDPQILLTEAQHKALQAEIAKVGPALVEARKLKDLPRGRHAVTYTGNVLAPLPPFQMDSLKVARLLDWEVRLLAQENDGDRALDSCRALLNTCRSFGDDPSLMSFLVRLATQKLTVDRVEHTLAQTEPSPGALRKLQTLLEDEEAFPLVRIATRGVRAGTDQVMQALQNGEIGYQAYQAGVGLAKLDLVDLQMMYYPGALVRLRAALLEFTTQLAEAAKLPAHEQQARFRELDKTLKQRPALDRFMGITLRYFLNAGESPAQLRCTLVGVAAERYRREHGRWPENISALVMADLLKEVPIDPVDGQPLRWRRLADGLVVYSGGPRVGDDGSESNRADGRPASAFRSFRLWDVPHRRQPSRPKKPGEKQPG